MIPWIEIGLAVLLVVLPFLLSALPALKKKPVFYGVLQVVAVTLFGYYYVAAGCDMDKEEAMEYDQLVRNKQWQEIIEKAEEKSPVSPFGVTCLNLALGKTGQMGDRMFEFYQNGTEGLLPEFQRDFTSPLPTSEAYYHLGMVNTAQRFTFEAMEAIPNFNKSGRCFKRLAETNLINGQYEVAAKYLRLLRKTIFYKDWAEDAMTYLYNEEKINAHKEWGWLRQIRYTEDFLFSSQETDIMLALRYLLQCARQAQKPLVICFGLGTNQGDHSGYMPLAEALDTISRMNTVYVVSAAGNEAGRGHHFYGKMENTSDYQNVEVLVPENEGGFTMELWASPPDLFAVGMISPLGETIPPIPPRAGSVTSISFLLEQTVIEVSYEPVEIASGGQLVFLRVQNPTPGIWGFQIYPRQISSGIFHIWLPISGFAMENTRFLNSNPDTTIVCPSNAEGVITCAAYNHATGGLFIQSSRGYTRTGNIKPDIASPGVEVYGARSSASKFAKPGFGRESGTSISAALTAGATALFVNWGLQSDPPRYFTNREIKSLLIRGATRSSNLLYPNREWGYGTLNLYQIFQVLL